ncbi:hypothetical protein EXS66_02350 [Candidatus Saccharibacteria bacterium]|nr:hypothetical protein [Candidatus Saccharibacteria bacterium]
MSTQMPPLQSSDEEQGRVDLRYDQGQHGQTVVACARELKLCGFDDEFIKDYRGSTLVGANISVRERLDSLSAQDFKKPIALIEKFPQILSYSPENINRRVRLFGRLVRIFDSPINPVEMMEQETALFGTKLDKLLALTRIVRNSLHVSDEIDRKLIHDIVFANLEDVMLALEGIGEAQHSTAPQYTIQDILARVRQIKAQKIPKDTKRSEIESAEYIDPKVRQQYFRGYPLKKDKL